MLSDIVKITKIIFDEALIDDKTFLMLHLI